MNLSKTQYNMPHIKSILLFACLLCYSSAQALWLSPDPLLDKYPYISPYAYCNWNPIKYVDPDGRDWYDPGDGSITWHNEATSQGAMNKVGIKGIYLGKNVLVGKH